MNKKNNRILFSILLLTIATGLVCDFFYKNSPQHAVRTSEFQRILNKKEAQAETVSADLQQIIIHSSVDSIIHYPFIDNDIFYYVFENNNLVFWSDNNLDISNISLGGSTDWHYLQLPNSQCISKIITSSTTNILAIILLKNQYTYENNELINNFAKGFYLDKGVRIEHGLKSDKNAIFSTKGKYIFSLSVPQTPIFNEVWQILGLFFYSIAFLIFMFLYIRFPFLLNKKTISLLDFIKVSLSVGLFIGLGLYFNLPSSLFLNKIFTPFQYASNPFLESISHLTIATGYLISTICLFYFYVNIDIYKTLSARIFFLAFFGLYFILIYYLLSGLIYHSSIQLSILHFNEISVVTLWIHFLILLWGIGLALLFLKTHKWFKKNHLLRLSFLIDLLMTILLGLIYLLISPEDTLQICISFFTLWLVFYLPIILPKYKNYYVYIACWTFIFSVFLVLNSAIINNHKKENKYKILAQNISINGNTENDRMAEILLEELDLQISNDRRIGKLVADSDSILIANEYLNKTYLRGFWNKYDMRLSAASIHTSLYNDYSQFITKVGTQIKNTHFYYVPANESNMSYIGKFQTKKNRADSIFFFMEFYPRRNYKSYSFPNLLIASTPNIQTQLNIAISKYEHQKLVYSSGDIEFPANTNWIPKNKYSFFTVIDQEHRNYIYAPNSTSYIVITEQQLNEPISYLLYFLYSFLAYFSIGSLVVWSYILTHRKGGFRLGLTAKFQYTFIILLIISFILIFFVSVNFIKQKYQEQQIANLESKKSYIQKALQEMYYWNQDLSNQNMQALNFDLQELSYTYHTDIHVYDNRGVLVGSSQPLIFNKGLISKLISPKLYFTQNVNINQYEHIGKLNYLTGYTDFYNGDFLQIGYIAIPQFFSQDEIRSEIESFLAVIIHIYFIIIVLAILLSLLIGKQLSAPLNMLESKLKEMRLGRRNEKIDYTLNDEIGQLVIQYNLTVDELEQSAKLLAQSERESAWKSMARQVAHEINNPLTPMKLSIQQLQRTKNLNDKHFDDYFVKSTAMLIEQIDNLSRIAGTFSDFARMPEANFERVDIASRLYSVAQLFANNYDQIEIEYLGEDKDVFVYADPEQLVQVFNNLLKNAIQAIPTERNGKIQIQLKQEEKRVIIHIIDNGLGIIDEAHDKLFAPNFTTKTTGMGLGLAIAKNIIELSGGTIAFSTELNVGTTFTVTLPEA